MPDQKNRGNSDFSKYDRMSDEELEDILRLDLENAEGTESDADSILYIMGVLADRDHTEPTKSAEEAFESFKENYYPLEKSDPADKEEAVLVEHGSKKTRKRRWIHGSIVAAAMIALVLFTSVSANAFKFDLWGELVKWTEEVFHFGSNFQSHQEEPFEEDIEFDSLIEAMEKKKIPTDIIPTWLPAGYKFSDVNIQESPKNIIIVATFIEEKSGRNVKIQVKECSGNYVQQIEKSNKYFGIYVSHGKKYYIFDNNKLYQAVCAEQNYELYIAGNINLEDLYIMLDSIKGE